MDKIMLYYLTMIQQYNFENPSKPYTTEYVSIQIMDDNNKLVDNSDEIQMILEIENKNARDQRWMPFVLCNTSLSNDRIKMDSGGKKVCIKPVRVSF